MTIIGVILATIWAQGSKRGKPPGGRGGSRRRTTTVLGSLEFAPRQGATSNVDSEMAYGDGDGDEDEDEDEDGLARSKQVQARVPAMREREKAPSEGVVRRERSVLFQSVGDSIVGGRTIDEVVEEKRVSESSDSSSGDEDITDPEPHPEPHDTPAASDHGHDSVKQAHAPPSPTSAQEPASRSVDGGDDPISYAV